MRRMRNVIFKTLSLYCRVEPNLIMFNVGVKLKTLNSVFVISPKSNEQRKKNTHMLGKGIFHQQFNYFFRTSRNDYEKESRAIRFDFYLQVNNLHIYFAVVCLIFEL
jgi:hypothetical protein